MATTTQTVTQKPKSEKAGVAQLPASKLADLSLSDALSALEHLTKRGLLCSKCGYEWAEWDNAYHSLCEGCKGSYPNMTFNRKTNVKGSDFEKLLCSRLRDWVRTFAGAEVKGNE